MILGYKEAGNIEERKRFISNVMVLFIEIVNNFNE